MNRKFIFCSTCCSEFRELDNNSWGDTSVYYDCKKSKRGRMDRNDWDDYLIPDDCKLKLEYATLTKEAIECLWRIGIYGQIIEGYEKEKIELQKKMNELDDFISERNGRIAEWQDKLDKLTDDK